MACFNIMESNEEEGKSEELAESVYVNADESDILRLSQGQKANRE